MTPVGALALTVATACAMEGVAWAAHKYIMHGPGWSWHRSHHEDHQAWFELNDLYAVLFAAIAVVLFVAGPNFYEPLRWIAAGMTLYGCLYVLVHDGLVHQRWPFRHTPRNPYLKRLVQAHRLHHAVEGRERCVSFGFLYAAPVRRLKGELGRLHPRGVRTGTFE